LANPMGASPGNGHLDLAELWIAEKEFRFFC